MTENLAGWPAGKARRNADALRFMRTQQVRRTCGWQGCEVVFEGTGTETHNALSAHREEAHPDFVPYKRPRVKREPRSFG